jgi:D-alanyl-D-alanine carboxypeptidase
MHAASPDALRHPASLTKIMTLYLLFERLEAGKIKLDSPLQVSEHASEQSPTKLGLKPDSTIRVEEAIKGMVTRSANDAAVVVAENLGGSESEFAKMMTAKAHALGMTRTVYKNASGLPDDDQVTTARDQSILGRAIQERFPRYYKYFQTRSFSFRGQSIGNHNRLLGRVEGVDGIKTGYTRASGFNLVTSVHRDGHYLVAVVLGGASAGSRDARMRELIDEYIDDASVKRTAPMVAEGAPAVAPAQAKVAQAGFGLASAASTPVRLEPRTTAAIPTAATPTPRPSPGSTEPIRPVMVKTLQVKPGATHTASLAPLHLPSPPQHAESHAAPPAKAEAPVAPPAAPRSSALSVQSALAMSEPAPGKQGAAPKPHAHSGWMIQVGAFPAESEAKQRLDTAKSKASKLLATAEPFTETVLKGDTTLYRARFAGFDKEKAEAACSYLKRNAVECISIKN